MVAAGLLLDASYNFRDLGGLPTEDGGRLRRGWLFRSATLHDVTAEEAAVLRDELGIACVVDLRTPDEIAAQGSASVTAYGIRRVSLPVLVPPLPSTSDSGDRDLLVSRYFAYLDRSTPNVVAALRVVAAEAAAPVAFHCTSGKDRTGILAGLLLRLLGVTREAVGADYAVTAGNMTAVMERLARCGPRPLEPSAIPPDILRAEGTTLLAFLDRLEGRFGTIRDWAFHHGLESGAIADLEAALLEPAPIDG